MKRIIITLLALATLGGVASADRGRGPVVRDHRTWSRPTAPVRTYTPQRNWGRTYQQPRYSHSRPTYTFHGRSNYRVERHPIYVQRPTIRYRYYNYYQRPALIVENYPAMAGYYWVAGQWQWNGYEWMWQPGHYEPDPNDDNGAYYDDGTYYDDGAPYNGY